MQIFTHRQRGPHQREAGCQQGEEAQPDQQEDAAEVRARHAEIGPDREADEHRRQHEKQQRTALAQRLWPGGIVRQADRMLHARTPFGRSPASQPLAARL